jgi:rsbT co-antagonist protein RsbR
MSNSSEITALRQELAELEAQVAVSRSRKAFFDHAVDSFCIVAPNGHVKHCNQSMLDTLGYSFEEITSQRLLLLAHPDDLVKSTSKVMGVIQGDKVKQFENRYRRKDGNYIRFLWNSLVNEETKEVFATARDVTAIRELEKERQLFISITQNLQFGLLIVQKRIFKRTPILTLIAANPFAGEIVNHSDFTKQIGQPINDVFSEVDYLKEIDYDTILSSQEAVNFVTTCSRADGKELLYRVLAFPLNQEQIGILIEDITARSREEETLRQAKIQDEIIKSQQRTLDELSTPLIPINDSIVIMPLIGSMDSRRAQNVLDSLLNGIAESRSTTLILDITGVAMVDTQVANVLLRATEAVKLLGANTIITGIRPEVAQTLIHLGVDLSNLRTLSSLQSGIAFAYAQEGKTLKGRAR